MKVVLTEDVKKLGSKGDVVEAADGYARSYLMPRGLAVEATQQKIKEMKEKEAKKNRLENEKREDANKLKSKLNLKNLKSRLKLAKRVDYLAQLIQKILLKQLLIKAMISTRERSSLMIQLNL